MSKRERQLTDDWIDTYRKKYIVKQESPPHFHFWIATQLIATALRRNVSVDRGAYEVFPNQFVFLVAESGRCRKSVAMELGIDLIKEIDGLNIIHGRSTVEGLLDSLSKKTKADFSGNRVVPDGSCLIHADELSYLFGKSSYITDLISFLTAAYTAKARLDFLTRNKGKAEVRNPCPGILAGTTPQQMGEIFPSMTIYSGFMARCLLIYGTTAQSKRVTKPEVNRGLEDILIHDLGCIAELSGKINLDKETEEFYDEWYTNLPPSPMPDLEAFHERKHDHVLKLALILSISESDEMVIKHHHLIRAIEEIETIELHTPQALAYIGATQQSHTRDIILRVIKSVYPDHMRHSTVLQRVYRRLVNGAVEFNLIIDQLVDEELIEKGWQGGALIYKAKVKGHGTFEETTI